ncbi:DNA-binding response regulator [Marinomonas piezotolerans]|uniref:DNA-binding response regulator n=1 Tax=Marinomonas piezotolerans TaxID=2213058 RepID=A0A370UBJ2_9GAMM|nr:response regulator transcription factor [Marinomonas piezotolerans]RDL45144.1 DNA-binding response regulator [Marinomonas piezotolerans]
MGIGHILIVEDLPEVATWMQQCIAQSLPHEAITTVCNLAQANQALTKQPWGLVLLDLGLPDGDGTDFIRPFKQHNPNAHCVITTIFDDAEHVFPALAAGADGYLLKDETEAEFCTSLSGILAGRPPLSSSIALKILSSFRQPRSDTEYGLTPRERDILVLIAKGYSCKDAAQSLGVTYHTAAGYLKAVYQKLQVNNRAEATIKAIEMGMITTSSPP